MWCMNRYLYVDHMLTAVQASPQNKVATLSSESLELMASAKAEMQSMVSSQVYSSAEQFDPTSWPNCCPGSGASVDAVCLY